MDELALSSIPSSSMSPREAVMVYLGVDEGEPLNCPECARTFPHATTSAASKWRHLDTCHYQTDIRPTSWPTSRGCSEEVPDWTAEGSDGVGVDEHGAGLHRMTLEEIPEAERKIAFDKFHVVQALGKAVDYIRRMEHAELMRMRRPQRRRRRGAR